MRFDGALRSENVGMSNRNPGEIPGHRKSKVSLATTIVQGLGGPKEKAKAVSDGQPVNIPALPHLFLRVTEGWRMGVLLDLLFPSGEEFWLRPEQPVLKSFLEKP